VLGAFAANPSLDVNFLAPFRASNGAAHEPIRGCGKNLSASTMRPRHNKLCGFRIERGFVVAKDHRISAASASLMSYPTMRSLRIAALYSSRRRISLPAIPCGVGHSVVLAHAGAVQIFNHDRLNGRIADRQFMRGMAPLLERIASVRLEPSDRT
jgi:hypothetical protein